MANDTWVFAGLASSFPNIEPSPTDNSNNKRSKTSLRTSTTSASTTEESTGEQPLPPPCKILQLNQQDPAKAQDLTADEAQLEIGLQPQVLVFRYRNKFHAVNHACPHRTYPLSRGSIYDIEDFGIVLSAGITCPGHGWAFDLFTGESDRGSYRLELWDIEVRKGEDSDADDQVWVRRREKKRIG